VKQRGFAGTDRASYNSETLALKNTLKKHLESSTVRIG
jgi:hypothetical protein